MRKLEAQYKQIAGKADDKKKIITEDGWLTTEQKLQISVAILIGNILEICEISLKILVEMNF